MKTPARSPADRVHLEECEDIAIVGAGISSAYTLIHYISLLEQQVPQQPVKIVVLEKSGEFWTGIPYGNRSGHNSLLIHALKEFITQPAERAQFTAWLSKNRDWVFNTPERRDGELSSQWMKTNEVAMSTGRWDDLFIPRYTFGLYMQQRMPKLLEAAAIKGLIEFKLLVADVVDIQRSEDLYKFDIVVTEGTKTFLAKKVILALGSPPNTKIRHSGANTVGTEVCFIDDMYEPSLDANIQRICESLHQSADRQCHNQVLLIGSNASTLDTLYVLANSPAAISSIDKFLIISPNAAFPHRTSREPIQSKLSLKHLKSLAESTAFTAEQILTAVREDVAYAQSQNVNIADIYHDISKSVIEAVDKLSFVEQEKFVSQYGVEIGKLQRRAGVEYLDVVDDLVDRGKLEFLKGKFVRCLEVEEGEPGFEYVVGEDREGKVFNAPIGVVINCAGFQDIPNSASVLIQNLLRRGICVPNDSQRGFLMNENFETSKNCYLVGPAIAGNINSKLRVWHAESCARIIGLSQQLAEVLIQSDV